jgi:hypothetical protein
MVLNARVGTWTFVVYTPETFLKITIASREKGVKC